MWIVVALVALQAVLDADLALWVIDKVDALWLDSEKKARPFSGQVHWVTGASSGIGAALALDLVAGGAKVIISARRQEQLLAVQKEASVKFPTSKGFHAIEVIPLDVLDLDAQSAAVEAVLSAHGRIDSLVLNAGRTQRALAVDFPLKDTRDIFELNFFSYVSLTKLVLPSMQKQKQGKLVVMSSVAGKMGVPISGSYSATKWALHGYYDALRSEVSRDGISVLLVCPGPVQSEIVSQAMLASASTPSGAAVRSGANEDNEKKMSTARCTRLVAVAMWAGLHEVWISQQPILFFVYLAEYAPGFARQLWTRVVGPSRVKTMLAGGDVYDIKNLFGLGSGAGKK